jgi:hypothetical protein
VKDIAKWLKKKGAIKQVPNAEKFQETSIVIVVLFVNI